MTTIEERRDTAEMTAAEQLARERAYDAAALRIAERVRESVELEDVLQQTLNELGPATGVSRALIQLAPNQDGYSVMFEWDRGDTRPLGLQPPTAVARRVFATGEPYVLDDIAGCGDADISAYLEGVGTASVIALPVTWKSRVVAVLGFQDDVPHRWRDDALPLLQRLDTQIAAAIAQAELFDQQQAALEQMRNLHRMREELVANVSHELRTPLAAIRGVAQTLKREDADKIPPDERLRLLDALDDQTERLALLAHDLLDLSRFRRGGQNLNIAPTMLSRLLERTRSSVPMPTDRTLHTSCDYDGEVRVDAHRILQVLSNLITNAVRHGQGDVYVRGFEDGERLVLHVSDEGGGVPPGYEEEMFEPFVHDPDRTDSSGLGLAIARAIVEAHGGTLVYLPATEDERHQFVVTLPQARP